MVANSLADTEKELDPNQQHFIQTYFEEEVRSNIIPLMVESIPQFPYLRDKSIYLGVVLSRQDGSMKLVNLTARIKDLLAITKLLTVFETFDSESDAVRSFSASAAKA